LDEGGRGLRSVSVVLQNASTGAVRSAVTNTFGNFSFAEVPAGDLYIISVSSKRYVFAPDSIAFQVNDNVAGLTFNVAPTGPVIQLPTVGKTAAAVPAKVSKY